jgi:hypothetical protein
MEIVLHKQIDGQGNWNDKKTNKISLKKERKKEKTNKEGRKEEGSRGKEKGGESSTCLFSLGENLGPALHGSFEYLSLSFPIDYKTKQAIKVITYVDNQVGI